MLQDDLALQTFELKEFSDEKLVTVAPNTLLTDAIALMSQESISCVLIEEQEQLQGIFTERDLVKLTAARTELGGLAIAEVMTPQPIALSTTEHLNLLALISLLSKHGIRHLPLVDGTGKTLGIITHRSLRKAFKASYLLKHKQVKEVMQLQVVQATGDRNIFQIADLLATHQVSCVVIVERESTEQPDPQGIVTEKDVVNYQALGLDLHQIPVQEVMSTPLLPISSDASLWDAHQLMQQHQIRRLVVTNQEGILAGIITQTTILQALDREDLCQSLAELEQLVREKTAQLEAKIAEQKLLEQNLQNSQAQLRSILAGITDIILILDEQARDIQVLSMDTAIAPPHKQELVNKTIEQFWQPETSPKFLIQVQQVMQTRQMVDFEYSIDHEDRQYWFTAQINPMPPNSVIWIARDISRRKSAEIALQNAKIELEDQVWQRTQELQIANLLLQQQINRFFRKDPPITASSQASTYLRKLNQKITAWFNNIYQDRFPLWTGGAIATVIALTIELLRQSGIIVPVPFIWLVITVTLSASFGGIIAGFWAVLVWAIFVIYAASVPFGPETLTGGVFQITIGIVVLGIVALIEGWTKEQNRKLTGILQFVNRNLDREVTHRTQELATVNASLKREIRDRIASRRALQKSEQKFRAIFNQTFQLCSFLKPDGTMIEANQTALDFGGLTLEDVVGKPFWETYWWTISPATQDKLKKAIARAAQGEFIRYEVDVWGKDQQVITIDFSLKPIFDRNGEVIFLIPEGRDISDRVKAEAKLKASEAKFRAIFEQAAVGIAHVGLDKKLLRVNQKFADILGYSTQELQQLSFDKITYPGDRASDKKHLQQLIRGEIATLVKEKRYIRKDSSPVWVKLTTAPVFDADDKPEYFISVIEDVSQRKATELALEESEARFFNMVNSFPALVWISGTDGLYTFFNHAWLDFTGRNIEQELGSGWSEGIHPDDLESYIKTYQSAFKQHQHFQLEYRLRRFDGEYRWLLDEGMPRFKSDGGFAGYIGTSIDITDLKRAKEIKKDAENKALMLKEIHHRIKNNLQIVSALLDLQSEQTQNPEIIDLLEKSQARIHTMGLIHEKIYGSATLDKINFVDYVDSLTRYLQTSFIPDEKKITIILDIEPIYLNIDSAIPCGLIINELVINALKHSFLSQLQGEIKISFSQLAPERFCLTVQDNGSGIRENIDLENIQSLGLSLVNSLATIQLEGTLEIQRVNGTLFKIEFPLVLA